MKAKMITYEDCLKFKEEHPEMSRHTLASYSKMFKAMKEFSCLDELYPPKQIHRSFTDEELIAIAQQYETIRDLKEHDRAAQQAIYARGLKDKAFAHMKPLGDKKHRMIYAYEFPDNYAYVGLTFDIEHRDYQHKNSGKSAVAKHIQDSGLEPKLKYLTKYLPVKEAQRLEGFYVEKYRNEGWNILNVEATGGIGGGEPRIDKNKIIELFKQSVHQSEIIKTLGVSASTVGLVLKEIKHKTIRISAKVEMLDNNGNVIRTFESAYKAAEFFGKGDQTIRNYIRLKKNTYGCTLRYIEGSSRHQYKTAI